MYPVIDESENSIIPSEPILKSMGATSSVVEKRRYITEGASAARPIAAGIATIMVILITLLTFLVTISYSFFLTCPESVGTVAMPMAEERASTTETSTMYLPEYIPQLAVFKSENPFISITLL